MLTDNQLKELMILTNHPKYGKLLLDAIEIWKKENVFPKTNSWGINIDYNSRTYIIRKIPPFTDCVCLLGASLVGKNRENYESFVDSVSRIFRINHAEVEELLYGFDGNNITDEDNDIPMRSEIEAYLFGFNVKQIVSNGE